MANEDVKKEAKELLDKFGKDLDKLDIKPKTAKSKGVSFRQENKGESCDVNFKAIMFKNAKRKNDSYLLLEKGSWN